MTKNAGASAIILGFAAVGWFSWGMSTPGPGWMDALVTAGLVAAVLAGTLALVRMRHATGEASMGRDAAATRSWWIWLIVEVVLIVGGMAVLAALDLSDYASTWVVLVMGLHFIPLAGSFGVPFLHVTAWACVAVAVAALLVGLLTDSSPHPWAAAGAGLALVLSSLATSSGVGPRSPAGAAAGIPAR